MHEDSFIDMVNHAEDLLGPEAREREAQEERARQMQRERANIIEENKVKSSKDNFFFANLGADKKGKLNIGKVPIQRSNPFTQVFGDVHEDLYAFMLEELDDDVDCLLKRLKEIDENLDLEIEKL